MAEAAIEEFFELFILENGAPMQFSMSICEEFNDLKKLIIKYSGELTARNGGKTTIRLVPKSYHVLAQSRMREDIFSSQYIHDCIEQEAILDLNKYRIGKSVFTDEISVVDILYGKKSWADVKHAIQEESGEENSEISDDEESYDQPSLSTSKKKRAVPYNHEERLEILNYIVNNQRHSEVKGNKLWQEMHRKKVCVHHTAQSMREHFRKYILKHLDQFPHLGENDLKLFRQMFNLTLRKKPRNRSKTAVSENRKQSCNGFEQVSNQANSLVEESLDQGKKYKKIPSNANYTPEEDISVVKYVYEHRMKLSTGGNLAWKELEKSNLIKDRTWQGLKERFRKRIMPRIESLCEHGLPVKLVRYFTEKEQNKNVPMSTKKISKNGNNLPYTLEEDKLILDFIVNGNWFCKLKGKALWVLLVKTQKNLKNRNWESVRGRFLKNISSRLNQFDLQLQDIEKFNKYLSGSVLIEDRRKRRIQSVRPENLNSPKQIIRVITQKQICRRVTRVNYSNSISSDNIERERRLRKIVMPMKKNGTLNADLSTGGRIVKHKLYFGQNHPVRISLLNNISSDCMNSHDDQNDQSTFQSLSSDKLTMDKETVVNSTFDPCSSKLRNDAESLKSKLRFTTGIGLQQNTNVAMSNSEMETMTSCLSHDTDLDLAKCMADQLTSGSGHLTNTISKSLKPVIKIARCDQNNSNLSTLNLIDCSPSPCNKMCQSNSASLSPHQIRSKSSHGFISNFDISLRSRNILNLSGQSDIVNDSPCFSTNVASPKIPMRVNSNNAAPPKLYQNSRRSSQVSSTQPRTGLRSFPLCI